MAKFCSDINFENRIIDILCCNNGIFSVPSYPPCLLNIVYDFLRNEYYNRTGYQLFPHPLNPTTLDINRLNIYSNKLIYDPYKIYIGHDLPVWLTPDDIDKIEDKSEHIKRVMFISQDPRRSLNEMTNSGQISPTPNLISFSSPFGVHSNSYITKPKQGLFARVAKRLSDDPEKKIIVYMTDFYKFRVAEKKGNIFIDTTNTTTYDNILKEEVTTFDPDLIVLISDYIAIKWINNPIKCYNLYTNTNYYKKTIKSVPVYHTAYKGLFSYLRKTYSPQPFPNCASVENFYFNTIYQYL